MVLVMAPVIVYLAKIRRARLNDILSYFNALAVKSYYKQFRRSQPEEQRTISAFAAEVKQRFSWRYYVIPLSLLFVLLVLLMAGSSSTLQVWFTVQPANRLVFSGVGVAALAGGAMWIVSDELTRLRKRDFTTTDVYGYVFRLLLCVPFGWALSRVVLEPAWLAVAFFMGGFPTTTLFQIARRLGAQSLKLGDDNATGALELEQLQCINRTNAERFQDEGINAISQLAYCDPIDLTLRTSFDFNYVGDCVSQALLWIYVPERFKELYCYSLRGAQEVGYFVGLLRNNDQNATETLAAAAAKLSVPTAALRLTLEQVADDPYTEFLRTVWH